MNSVIPNWNAVGVNFGGSNQSLSTASQSMGRATEGMGSILDRLNKEEMFKQEQANKAIEQQRLAGALMLQRETA